MEDLAARILFQKLSREAIQLVQGSTKLASVLQGNTPMLPPERTRQVRIWVARLLARCGFFHHARRLLASAELRSATDYLFGGYFEMAFGDLAAALPHFTQARKLDPHGPWTVGSYFHVLGHAGQADEALDGLTQIQKAHPVWDERGWTTVRLGETLRLLGRTQEALLLLRGKLESLEANPPPPIFGILRACLLA